MSNQQIYDQITGDIVSAIEDSRARGEKLPWAASWASNLPQRVTGEAYKGINQLYLGLLGAAKSYQSSYWMTYKQAKSLDAQVKRGSKSARVVYYKSLVIDEGDEPKTIPMLKSYSVFNADQIDGLDESWYAPQVQDRHKDSVISAVENAIKSTGAKIEHGGNRAYYSHAKDFIGMPDAGQFDSQKSYYATLLHELTHWTGHKNRLDRKVGRKFADQDYAREELVAELGSAFLCGSLGIESEDATMRDDHAGYIDSWLHVLKTDSKAIFKAASAAQKAADYVLTC